MIGRVKHGSVHPLGATVTIVDGLKGVNFAVFSENATLVELCLFSASGREQKFKMYPNEDNIWTLFLAGIEAGIQYGYRVHGKFDLAEGHSFNPAKVMLDPYAKALSAKPHYASEADIALYDMMNDLDNGKVAPKAIVVDEHFDWEDDHFPNHPWSRTIIYEVHVKGFSQLNSIIPEHLRGSYAGLAHQSAVDYLKNLGITAIELLPVLLHGDELHLQRKGLSNYWGYSMLAPFAVESDYWSGNSNTTPLAEFKAMVKTLHKAGIEVILDVVFNHTLEADYLHPTLCQRGLDNKSYYWLDEQGEYYNWSGCGNALNLTHPNVLMWVIDALRYWVEECHVDGFRFDLAPILGREPAFNRESVFFQQLKQDPILKDRKFIAEPWDIGLGGYQVGNFPEHFSEWNDSFRDFMRRFWLHQQGTMGEFARRFCASPDRFCHSGKRPSSSINYICSHDGFTLHDLVTYQQKYNWDNHEDNRDGHGDNYNNNFGIEGETADQAVLIQRISAQKALLASALLSKGVPMLLAGDEFGHSQRGNNNAYCQDNEIAWLDWSKQNRELFNYVSALIKVRKSIDALSSQDEWWSDNDVSWWNRHGQTMLVSDWDDEDCVGFQIEIADQWLLVIHRTFNENLFLLPEGNWKSAFKQNLHLQENKLSVNQAGIYVLYQ